MSEVIKAYPLQWPPGWPTRESYRRTRASFGKAATCGQLGKRQLSVADGSARVLHELGLMGVGRDDIVISTNLRLRMDGFPRGDQGEPREPGAAVYWKRKGNAQCMAIDRYDRVADNLAAIAATLEAMRAIERHGGGEILDRAFTGFIALPGIEQPWRILELKTSRPTRDQVIEAHKRLSMVHHPDRNGGDDYEMKRINVARDELLAGLK